MPPFVQIPKSQVSTVVFIFFSVTPISPIITQDSIRFFPTLAVGLLDFKVDVVLARMEAEFSHQPPSIPAVPNHQISLQRPTAEYPCSAQLQSIPAVSNHQISLQGPTAEYPCSARPPSIPAAPNRRVSLQCPTAKYPCSAQPPNIPAAPNQ